MANKKYTSEHISVLEGLEPVRQNPGMFIGSTSDATHLLIEALDNAADELMNDFANRIAIIIDDKNKIYTVIDNGRGIPLGKKDGIPVPIILATKLFSGGKFNKNVYDVSSGLHGVGLAVVNALCENMVIEVFRKDPEINENKITHAIFEFENSILKNSNYEFVDGDIPYSTRITFKPHKDYFEKISVDINYIRKRLSLVSIFSGNKEVILKINDKTEIIKETLNEYFEKNFKTSNFLFNPIFIKKDKGKERLELIFTYVENNEQMKVESTVNLITVSGGTHINILYDKFRSVFESYMKNYNFQKNDVFIGLKCYLNVFIQDTAFGGQTKDRLTTARNKLEPLFDGLEKEIKKELENLNVLETLLEKFQLYRSKLNTKNINKNLTHSTVLRGRLNKNSKLSDCKLFENSELFIIEGDSAGGNCIKARDPNIHAVLPLKGKVLNVAAKKSIDDILKNKEIQDIIMSLGCGYKSKNTEVDIDKLRYEKIILASDSDADGAHINTLLLISFMVLVPEIIKNGHLYIAEMPLYGVTYKKKFYPAWTMSEVNNLLIQYPNAKVTRFKGLGEMNEDQLYMTLFDKKTRKILQVEFPKTDDEYEELIKLMIDSNMKRQLVSEESLNI